MSSPSSSLPEESRAMAAPKPAPASTNTPKCASLHNVPPSDILAGNTPTFGDNTLASDETPHNLQPIQESTAVTAYGGDTAAASGAVAATAYTPSRNTPDVSRHLSVPTTHDEDHLPVVGLPRLPPPNGGHPSAPDGGQIDTAAALMSLAAATAYTPGHSMENVSRQLLLQTPHDEERSLPPPDGGHAHAPDDGQIHAPGVLGIPLTKYTFTDLSTEDARKQVSKLAEEVGGALYLCRAKLDEESRIAMANARAAGYKLKQYDDLGSLFRFGYWDKDNRRKLESRQSVLRRVFAHESSHPAEELETIIIVTKQAEKLEQAFLLTFDSEDLRGDNRTSDHFDVGAELATNMVEAIEKYNMTGELQIATFSIITGEPFVIDVDTFVDSDEYKHWYHRHGQGMTDLSKIGKAKKVKSINTVTRRTNLIGLTGSTANSTTTTRVFKGCTLKEQWEVKLGEVAQFKTDNGRLPRSSSQRLEPNRKWLKTQWERFEKIDYNPSDPYVMAFKAKNLPLRPPIDDEWFKNLGEVRTLIMQQVQWNDFPEEMKKWIGNTRHYLMKNGPKRENQLEIRRFNDRNEAFTECGLWDIGNKKATKSWIRTAFNKDKTEIKAYQIHYQYKRKQRYIISTRSAQQANAAADATNEVFERYANNKRKSEKNIINEARKEAKKAANQPLHVLLGLKPPKTASEAIQPRRSTRRKAVAKQSLDQDEHNDCCECCGHGGKVICCSTCTLVFHLGCTRPQLSKAPKGDFFCAYCILLDKDTSESVKREARDAIEKIEALKEEAIKIGE